MPRISGANLPEHREFVRTALLDAVDELSAQHGADAISLGDVAVRAGVARTVIYNYARDKAALLLAAAERATQGLRAAVADIAGADLAAPQRLDRIVDVLLVEFAQSAPRLFVAHGMLTALGSVEREQSIASFRDVLRGHLAVVIRDGASEGTFRRDFSPDLAADLVTGVLEAAVARSIASPENAAAIGQQTAVFVRKALRVSG